MMPQTHGLGVDQPDFLAGVSHRLTRILGNAVSDEIRNARARHARTIEQVRVVRKRFASDTAGRHEASNCDTRCALNVVVKRAALVLVAFQQTCGAQMEVI